MTVPVSESHKSAPLSRAQVLRNRRLAELRLERHRRFEHAREILPRQQFKDVFLPAWTRWAKSLPKGPEQAFANRVLVDCVSLSWDQFFGYVGHYPDLEQLCRFIEEDLQAEARAAAAPAVTF